MYSAIKQVRYTSNENEANVALNKMKRQEVSGNFTEQNEEHIGTHE